MVHRRLPPLHASHRPPASSAPAAARPSRTSPASPGSGRAGKASGGTPGSCGHRRPHPPCTAASPFSQVDRRQPLDQREVGAGQRPGRHLRLQQRPDRRQLLDPLRRQFGRRDPARGGQRQRPLGHQPPHRLTRRGHRHAEGLAQAPQGQRLPGVQLAMHDLLAQATGTPVHARQRWDRWGGWSAWARREAPRAAGRSILKAQPVQRLALGHAARPAAPASRDRSGPPPPNRPPNGSARPDAPPHARRHSPAPTAAP